MTNESNNRSDYAIARELHDRAIKLAAIAGRELQLYDTNDRYDEISNTVRSLNRSYVLVVNELEKIYAHNESLAKLNDEPSTSAIWKRFNLIEGKEFDILKWIDNLKEDSGIVHRAQVNRLAIIAGKETANFTPEQQKIVDEADKVIETFRKRLNEIEASRHTNKRKGEYYISKYTLTYADNGNIVINDVLALKKTQNGSAPRKLMEQAVKHPSESFKPELGQLTRSFSSVMNDMGITGALKEIFFPIATKDRVMFRPEVHHWTVDEERIDTNELDKQLMKLGAEKKHILEIDGDVPELTDKTSGLIAKYLSNKHLLDEDERNEVERIIQ